MRIAVYCLTCGRKWKSRREQKNVAVMSRPTRFYLCPECGNRSGIEGTPPEGFKRSQLTPEALKAIDGGIPENELFTPVDRGQGRRVTMRVDTKERDAVAVRTPGMHGIVTDKLTGKRYRVYGAPCGLGDCFCDSEVEEVK